VSGGESTISRDVNGFIRKISIVAMCIGLIFMGVGMGVGGLTWVQAIVLAIGVVVATVPEGLLVTFTVSLALTAKRMHSGGWLLLLRDALVPAFVVKPAARRSACLLQRGQRCVNGRPPGLRRMRV
jgi:hypothetical protein